jgi:4'-phosphopantetheinyl transferase
MLTALPEAERRPAFFTLWTLKESYMKAVGLGMALPLRSFWFCFDPTGTPSLHLADRDSDARCWRFSLFRPTERHVVALAVAQTEGVQTRARLHLTVPAVPRV